MGNYYLVRSSKAKWLRSGATGGVQTWPSMGGNSILSPEVALNQ